MLYRTCEYSNSSTRVGIRNTPNQVARSAGKFVQDSANKHALNTPSRETDVTG